MIYVASFQVRNSWSEFDLMKPAAAEELYQRLEARVETLKRFPKAGRHRPDIDPAARS
jgi:plasmid stabilization system protein ParE